MMNDQQSQQQQAWSPSQRWTSPQPTDRPLARQFKRPLPLPLPSGQQQDGQAQWNQQSSQHDSQPKQLQWPPLLQLPAHPKSPPPQPPSRHFKRRLWLILGIVALVVLSASIGVSYLASRVNTTSPTAMTSQGKQSPQPTEQVATQPASQPTAIPTQARATNWTTTHTFTGHSEEKRTTPFTVGNTWKIIWTCNPGTIFGGLATIIVNVFSSDGSFQHGAINDTCKAGHTTGNTIERQGGNIYLDITGGGNWVVQVQELK